MSIPSYCLLCGGSGPTPAPCPHDLKIGGIMTGQLFYDGVDQQRLNKEANIRTIVVEVTREVLRATAMFKPMNSPHEASAIIREEHDEYWDEVKAFNLRKGRDTRPRQREELIQLAAMAIRAITDTIDFSEVTNGSVNQASVVRSDAAGK